MREKISKGILLEQNKEPALSRKITTLEALPIVRVSLGEPPETPALLAPYEILELAKRAKIVDESDGRRIWKKLAQAAYEGTGGIVVDAIDDEPYLSSQLAPALQFSSEMIAGLQLAKRCIGAQKSSIEIYKNLEGLHTPIPAEIGGIRVDRIGGVYPAEYRIREAARRKNTMVIGAGALVYLYRAVYLAEAQTSCILTVAGDSVEAPGNYEVPLGASVTAVLKAVGMIAPPKRLVLGGSMTGYGLTNPDVAYVNQSTRGILAFAENFRDIGYQCIGCGRCTEVCPEGLSPYFIYKCMRTREKQHLTLGDPQYCIGCGTCSYVCPAKLDLSQMVLSAAKLLADRTGGTA